MLCIFRQSQCALFFQRNPAREVEALRVDNIHKVALASMTMYLYGLFLFLKYLISLLPFCIPISFVAIIRKQFVEGLLSLPVLAYN